MKLSIKGLTELRARLDQVRPAEVMAKALAEQAEHLAEAVRAGLSEPQGGGHDKPWLRTGALHDSVTSTANGLQAAVGSNDPAAAPQELGTSRIPPRPFLAPAAIGLSDEIASAVAEAVANAIQGEEGDGMVSTIARRDMQGFNAASKVLLVGLTLQQALEGRTREIIPVSEYKPSGTSQVPISGIDPLDPTGLNNELSPSHQEQFDIATTYTFIMSGRASSLKPHTYENRPSSNTGAALPPSATGYTAYDVVGSDFGVRGGEFNDSLLRTAPGKLTIRGTITKVFSRSTSGKSVRRGYMLTLIEFDASKWSTKVHFYDALLSALQSPAWHGKNLNALVDSLVYGGINSIEPPIKVLIHGLRLSSEAIRHEVMLVSDVIRKARYERQQSDGVDRDIMFEIVD